MPSLLLSRSDDTHKHAAQASSPTRLAGLLLVAGLLLTGRSAEACPFCSAPQLTIAEQIAQTDAAILAEWESGVRPDFDAGTPGSTQYRILKVIKSPKAQPLEAGQLVKIDEYYPEQRDLKALLVGTYDTKLSWLSPIDVSKSSFEYVLDAPSPENDPALRLKYYLKFLEASDPLVADDAYAEFANAPYDVIASIREEFPVEKLRKWALSSETAVTRLGLYGLMLGLAGDQTDAVRLERKISSNDEDFRLGIDGLMAGYLMLAGESGLTTLEQRKFVPALQQPSEVPFSETFAAMQAVKFLWEYEPNRVPKERMRASLKLLLPHPDLADLVIIDLARWEDWSLLPRLKTMYGAEPFNIPAIKRAIVGYLIQCVKQRPSDPTEPTPQFVTEAVDFLAELEQKDPKTVKTARLLFR